jgi:hypothetical protein
MIGIGEDAIHPDTGERIKTISFLRRSHEIADDGIIHWRAPGDGINQAEILRFTRRRIQALASLPAPVAR